MKKLLGSILISALLSGASAFADPMPLDGTWIALDEEVDVGDFFVGNWTWNSASSAKFTVTDWAVASDQFDIYDNGDFVFSTSDIPDSGAYELDFDAALAGGDFSNGSWIFGAGSHSISIMVTHIPAPFSDSTVAFKAETVSSVPDTASTAMLLAIGLFGLGLARGRRN